MRALIEKANAGVDLTPNDIAYAVTVLLSEELDDATKGEFLIALHQKGESAEEIAGFVEVLMQRAIDPMIDPAGLSGPMLDVCGTGGDGLDFFNVSTTIMFVLAAGGVAVVKHGNRSVTSKCGSADVLEQLRIPLNLPPAAMQECLKRHNMAFIFARQYHPAFRAVVKMRENLARENRRTIFNLLGPLLNPAKPSRQLIGVFAPHLTSVFADVLRRLGRERAWIVHGLADGTDGMDDISICGPTTVAELDREKVTSAVMDMQWLGLSRCGVEELRGGTPEENAKTLEGILSGEIKDARRDMTIANAAGGFVVAGLARDMNQGIAMAREQIDKGKALQKLRALQEFAAAV